jgi:hypothetical protein
MKRNWIDSAQDRNYWGTAVNATLNSGFHNPWSYLGIFKSIKILFYPEPRTGTRIMLQQYTKKFKERLRETIVNKTEWKKHGKKAVIHTGSKLQ